MGTILDTRETLRTQTQEQRREKGEGAGAPLSRLESRHTAGGTQQLELMDTGKVRTGEDIGAGWIDTTAESIERAKARLAELNDLLTEAGKATVVKPDAL